MKKLGLTGILLGTLLSGCLCKGWTEDLWVDLNEDGKEDVIRTIKKPDNHPAYTEPSITYLFCSTDDGDYILQEHTIFYRLTREEATGLILEDKNKDGRIDIILERNNQTLSLYNKGNCQFKRELRHKFCK